MKIKACQQVGHIKANSEGRTIYGYASIFGNVDSYGDRVMRGAFKKTIKERGPKGSNQIKFLWNHDPFQIPVGVLTELKEDDIGLYYEARILRTPKGDELLEAVREGAINRNSFGYTVIRSKAGKTPSGGDEELDVIDLQELKLFEISPVNWPANEDATLIGAKSVESQIMELLGKANPQKIVELMTTKSLEEKVASAIESRIMAVTKEEDLATRVAKSILEDYEEQFNSIVDAAVAKYTAEREDASEEKDTVEDSSNEIVDTKLTDTTDSGIIPDEKDSAIAAAPTTAGWEDVQTQLAEIMKTVQALAEANNPPADTAEAATETSPEAGVDPDIVQSLTAEIESLFDLE